MRAITVNDLGKVIRILLNRRDGIARRTEKRRGNAWRGGRGQMPVTASANSAPFG
jgi:hypothetical protein